MCRARIERKLRIQIDKYLERIVGYPARLTAIYWLTEEREWWDCLGNDNDIKWAGVWSAHSKSQTRDKSKD